LNTRAPRSKVVNDLGGTFVFLSEKSEAGLMDLSREGSEPGGTRTGISPKMFSWEDRSPATDICSPVACLELLPSRRVDVVPKDDDSSIALHRGDLS
jgi:hypothetical protein